MYNVQQLTSGAPVCILNSFCMKIIFALAILFQRIRMIWFAVRTESAHFVLKLFLNWLAWIQFNGALFGNLVVRTCVEIYSLKFFSMETECLYVFTAVNKCSWIDATTTTTTKMSDSKSNKPHSLMRNSNVGSTNPVQILQTEFSILERVCGFGTAEWYSRWLRPEKPNASAFNLVGI